jgi:hydroxyacylglutathione hydrolase
VITITPLPALRDNYIWVLHDEHHAVVVDPGESAPVIEFLQQHNLDLSAILCTHRHHDHIGGISKLQDQYCIPVYGCPHPQNPHITHAVAANDTLEVLGVSFRVLELKGHLDDHVGFVSSDSVFCGDILFGAGCGRNFEGSLEQLFDSLKQLEALPDATHVYCAHEYTLMNLRFAMLCDPENPTLQQRLIHTKALRAEDRPTLPSTIGLEKATNPFLRCNQPEIIETMQARGLQSDEELMVFMALRAWRNGE